MTRTISVFYTKTSEILIDHVQDAKQKSSESRVIELIRIF